VSDELDISPEELEAASATRLEEMNTASRDEEAGREYSDLDLDAAEAGDRTRDTQLDPALDPSVLDPFPSEVRTHLEGLPPEVLTELQKGYLRQSDYTKKAQTLSDARGELQADAADALAWRNLISNPTARAAVLGALEQNGTNGEQPFDWTTASSEEIDAEIDRRSRMNAERLLEEKVVQPQQFRSAVQGAAVAYRRELGATVSNEAFKRAYATMKQRYGEEALTPENVKLLLEPFVEIEQLRHAQNDGAAGAYTQYVDRAGRATSPPGTNAVAPTPKPRWVTEKRGPDEQERAAMTLHSLSRRYGQRVTMKDLDELLERGE
jgi:hypothetical protein